MNIIDPYRKDNPCHPEEKDKVRVEVEDKTAAVAAEEWVGVKPSAPVVTVSARTVVIRSLMNGGIPALTENVRTAVII